MTWYGHHHLCSTLNVWKGFIRGLIVCHLALIFKHAGLWQNEDGIMQQYRCIGCCINYHHHMSATFHYAADITLHTGQNLYHLFVPRVQTTLAKLSFYFRGTQIWNSLNPTLYTRKLEQFKSVYQSLCWLFVHVCSYVV